MTVADYAKPVPLDQISAGTLNPRTLFDEDALQDLAASITAHGVIQPIVIRPTANNLYNGARDTTKPYHIVAGERRFRAAQLAGLTEIPAIVRADLSDQAALEVTVIENLHRRDLEPLDEAAGYRMLRDLCGMKQKEIARQVNRSTDYIAESLRLLDLPDGTQALLREKKISVGQARALWKYRQFPQFVEALATVVSNASRYYTAEKIADLKETFGWQGPGHTGIGEDLIVDVTGSNFSDRAAFPACDKCPFGARFGRYCLKPEHYQQLAAAEKQERDAEAAERAAELKAKHGDTPTEGSLKPGEYHNLEIHKPPRGCGPDCPCRSHVVNQYTSKLIPICTDLKRFTGLERKQTREDNARRRKQDADDSDELSRYIGSWVEIPDDAIHMLAVYVLRQTQGAKDDPHMRHVRQILGDKVSDYDISIDGIRHVQVPTDNLVRAACEKLALGELERHAKADAMSVSYTTRHFADWLLQSNRATTPTITKPPENPECGSDSTTPSSTVASSGDSAETPSSSTSPDSSTAAATKPTAASTKATSKKSRTTAGPAKVTSAG